MKFRLVLVFVLALSLFTAACSSSNGNLTDAPDTPDLTATLAGPVSTTSGSPQVESTSAVDNDPAVSTAEGDGTPASSVADFSLTDALSWLPAGVAEGPVTVTMGELDAASRAAGVERPSDVSDDVATWIMTLTGGPAGGDEPVIYVPLAEVFRSEYIREVRDIDKELGWSIVDAHSFAERHTPPMSFAVIAGDFDESTLPTSLPPVAEGVVTAGSGEDFALDAAGRTAARPLGVPLRMALRDGRIAAGTSTPEVSAWLAGDVPTLADDEDLAVLAAALDRSDAIAAVLVSDVDFSAGSVPGEGDVPTDRFAAAGVGWSTDDLGSVITVVYAFDSPDAASRGANALRAEFDDGYPGRRGVRPADYLHLDSAEVDDRVAVLTVRPHSPAALVMPYKALTQRDVPMVHE